MEHVHEVLRVNCAGVALRHRRHRGGVVDPMDDLAPGEQLRAREVRNDRRDDLDLPDLLAPRDEGLAQVVGQGRCAVEAVVVAPQPRERGPRPAPDSVQAGEQAEAPAAACSKAVLAS